MKNKIEDMIKDTLEKFIGEPNTAATHSKMKSVLLPVIKNLDPTILANDIVGVQPMTGNVGQAFSLNMKKLKTPSYFVIEESLDDFPHVPDGHVVIDADVIVGPWIEEQPIHMWKQVDGYNSGLSARDRYIISEELLTWLHMRWS